jgi:hypothetical protein
LDFDGELTTADPDLGSVIAAVVAGIGPRRITPSRAAPFEALARAIAYRSVSGKGRGSSGLLLGEKR